jgi:hypothetical protein
MLNTYLSRKPQIVKTKASIMKTQHGDKEQELGIAKPSDNSKQRVGREYSLLIAHPLKPIREKKHS